jgi:hypothetical protein
MSVTLSPPPKLQFFDSNGNPLSGGLLYSYTAGTSTPLATYNDASGTTYNTNPVILDSRGEADVWLGAASYKFKLATAANVDIWTVDNIGGGDQFGTVQFLTGVSGSDTITATVTSSSFIAYAAGQMFNFVAAGTNATSSVTLNLNGLGAKTVTKKGTLALAAGDILAGQVITVVYDGARFQITNAVYLSAPPPIGDVTPNTGAFTTLNTTGFLGVITAAPTCAVDVTGGIKTSRVTVTTPATTDGNVFSGLYTPAQVSTNTNVASVTFGASYYMRVGNMVTVIGSVSITATASATDTILLMSLPIASNFSSSRNLSGTGASTSTGVYGSVPAAILGDTTDDCAQFRLRPTSTSAVAYQYSFTYLVA